MSGDRLAWFKCEPSKLLGALAGLPPDQGYLYTIILLRIYETGGPIPDDAGVLARRSGYQRAHVERALAALAEAGKIEVVDGKIDSPKTRERIAEQGEISLRRREISTTAAKIRWEKAKQNQQGDDAGRMPYRESESESKVLSLSTQDSSAPGASDLFGAEKVIRLEESPKRRQALDRLKGFAEAWNDMAGRLKLAQIDQIKPGSARERAALARLRDLEEEEIQPSALLAKVATSPYLRGDVNGFRASFDWIVKDANFQKIMEGNYESREQKQKFR